jgi:hypothetical protein
LPRLQQNYYTNITLNRGNAKPLKVMILIQGHKG